MVSDSKKQQFKEILLVSQEISFAKNLSSNDEKERRIALGKLARWLASRSSTIEFKEDDFNRLWKGLFYCLWMADKPLFQEEVVEQITHLVHCFTKDYMALLFVKSGIFVIGQDWCTVDHLRIDKFMMLVRRLIRQSFVIIKKQKWDLDNVKGLADIYRLVLGQIPDGLSFHIADIFLNELAKVGGSTLDSDVVFEMVKPFAELLCTLHNSALIRHISSAIFLNLLRQSELGIEETSKFTAWKILGFPGGTIESMKKLEDDDDDDDHEAENDENDRSNNLVEPPVLDPRAGKVDVVVPTIKFNPQRFINLFKELQCDKSISVKTRNQLSLLILKFSKFSSNEYPLGIKKVEKNWKINWKIKTRRRANSLIRFEQNEYKKDKTNYINGDETKCKKRKQEVEGDAVSNLSGKKVRKKSIIKSADGWNIVLTNNIESNSESPTMSSTKSTVKWEITDKSLENNRDGDSESIHNNSEVIVNQSKRKLCGSNNLNGSIKGKKIKTDLAIENGETEILIKSYKLNNSKKNKLKKKIGNSKNIPKKEGKQQPSSSEMTTSTVTTETPKNAIGSNIHITPSTSTGKRKRVSFLLHKNMVQEEREYRQRILAEPRIHFDATKQPEHPIFVDKGVRSPINPFYIRHKYLYN